MYNYDAITHTLQCRVQKSSLILGFGFRTVSDLREKGKLEIKVARNKQSGIESALGMKVYNANKKAMEVCDHFLLSIFKIMKNDNTLVGKKAIEYENAFIEGAKSEDEDDSGILKGSKFWNWFGSCCKPRI